MLPVVLFEEIQSFVGTSIMFCQDHFFSTNSHVPWDDYMENLAEEAFGMTFDGIFFEDEAEENQFIVDFCGQRPIPVVYTDAWLWEWSNTLYNNITNEAVVKEIGQEIHAEYGHHGMQSVFYFLNRTPVAFNGMTWSIFKSCLNIAWDGVGNWRT